jgi:tetratricopeptide (TPR) repeat protein
VRDLGQISRDPRLVGLACAAVIAGLLAAWTQWQPERSENASQQAIALLAHDPRGALAAAQRAVDRDPLSAQALITLATVQRASGHDVLARATLQRAVRLQPSNPQTWLTLGEYDLAADPRAALSELGAAIYLNPESIAPEAIAVGYPEAIEIQNDYVRALQDTTPPPRTVLNPPALSRLRAKGRATPGTPSGGRARKRRTAQ